MFFLPSSHTTLIISYRRNCWNFWSTWPVFSKTRKQYSKRRASFLKFKCSLSCTVVVVQSLSCIWLFATPWTAARQASLSFTISWSLLKLMSIESMKPSNHLILCCPLLLLPSIFPRIRVFSSESAHVPYEVYEVCLSLSHVWLLVTPWTALCKAPLSVEFSRQEHWSGLPCPRDQTQISHVAGRFLTIWATRVALMYHSLGQKFSMLCMSPVIRQPSKGKMFMESGSRCTNKNSNLDLR